VSSGRKCVHVEAPSKQHHLSGTESNYVLCQWAANTFCQYITNRFVYLRLSGMNQKRSVA